MTKRISNKGKKPKAVQAPNESVRPEAIEVKPAQNSVRSSPPPIRKGRLPTVVEGSLSVWKIAARLCGFLLVVVLNIALIMSDVSHHHVARPYSHRANEFVLYGLLLFFNSLILIPALFEVRWLKGSPEGLQLATLWWKAKLTWQDVTEFRHPRFLKFALLRTRRCFYILSRRDLTNYDLIEAVLAERVK